MCTFYSHNNHVTLNVQSILDMGIHVSLDLPAAGWLEFGTQEAVKQRPADICGLYFELDPSPNY